MKMLPLGIQTFAKLRENDLLYIDKTEHIYRMVTEGSFYFLSRPRRFGKSLTLSTLGALFEGRKELFKGLFIHNEPWEWKKWPVLRFDFSGLSEEQGVAELKSLIKLSLKRTIEEYGLRVDENLPYNQYFQSVMQRLPEKAVILIDEYDKPILNNITDFERADRIKEILKGFYTVIKGADTHVRFAFLTGVTKFAKISVFSGLNNLIDLTMKETYADLCGYTEEELDTYFGHEFSAVAKEDHLPVDDLREKIRDWYNGFRFSSLDISVYNPVSILNFVSERRFRAYWFETGTPTFLTQLMKQEGFLPENMEKISCRDSDFSTYDVEHLSALPILFQSGYLTILDYRESSEMYTLGYPNREVRSSFLESLLKTYVAKRRGPSVSPLIRLQSSIEEYDLESFFESIDILFAKIPYDIHLPYEKYWQSLFYMIFTLLGYYIEAEYRTSKGRIDAFINLPDRVYLFEFKLAGQGNDDIDGLLEEAKIQIETTDYAKRFIDGEKPIILLPVVFSDREERTIVSWKEINQREE